MHHSLYLLAVNPNKRANAVLAVRKAMRNVVYAGGQSAANEPQGDTTAATKAVQHALDGKPALIGRHADTLVLQESADDFTAQDGCVVAVDPTPEQIIAGEVPQSEVPGATAPGPPATPGGADLQEPCAPEAYETAMVLLCAMDGNPFSAWSIAGTLRRTTHSEGFEEVQRAILRVFPPDVPTKAIIAQITEGQPE